MRQNAINAIFEADVTPCVNGVTGIEIFVRKHRICPK